MINKMTSYYKLLSAINNIVSINSMAAVNNSSNQLYGNNQRNNITISEATFTNVRADTLMTDYLCGYIIPVSSELNRFQKGPNHPKAEDK